MTKPKKAAGDLAKAKGGKLPPAANASPVEQKDTATEKAKETAEEEPSAATGQTGETAGDVAAATPEQSTKAEDEQPAADEQPDNETVDSRQPGEAANDDAGTAGEETGNTKKGFTPELIAEAKKHLAMMDKIGADELYKNQEGEFFTVENFAMLSVGNERKKLLKITRRMLQVILKGAE